MVCSRCVSSLFPILQNGLNIFFYSNIPNLFITWVENECPSWINLKDVIWVGFNSVWLLKKALNYIYLLLCEGVASDLVQCSHAPVPCDSGQWVRPHLACYIDTPANIGVNCPHQWAYIRGIWNYNIIILSFQVTIHREYFQKIYVVWYTVEFRINIEIQ